MSAPHFCYILYNNLKDHMFFWFKKPKIVLDAFCANEKLVELFGLEPADGFLPKWYKDLPNMIDNPYTKKPAKITTMKYCPGIRYLYEKSWMFRLWSDYTIKVDNTGGMDVDSPYFAESHPPGQSGGGWPNMINCKLCSPWRFREKTGVLWTWMGAEYNHPGQHYRILNGVVDYKYQHITHINTMLPVPEKLVDGLSALQFAVPNVYTYHFKAGTPMIMIAPMTEQNVEVRSHAVTEQEFSSMQDHRYTASNVYYNTKKLLKDKEARTKKKCPFKFS